MRFLSATLAISPLTDFPEGFQGLKRTYTTNGSGAKLSHQGTPGRPCFHLPGASHIGLTLCFDPQPHDIFF